MTKYFFYVDHVICCNEEFLIISFSVPILLQMLK